MYLLLCNWLVSMLSCENFSFVSSQFITDKFLYDQRVAMESLLECGLTEQLFELAKVHAHVYLSVCTCMVHKNVHVE